MKHLADSSPEVINGVLQRLGNPIVTIQDDYMKWPELKGIMDDKHGNNFSYQCSCAYCSILLVYTYLKIEYKKADKHGRSTADSMYRKLEEVKAYKDRLESMPKTDILKYHIENAKNIIGKGITNLRSLAIREMQRYETIINKAKYIVYKNNINVLEIETPKLIDWF